MPLQFNMLHVLPQSKIPVDKLPIDSLLANVQSLMRKKEREGISNQNRQVQRTTMTQREEMEQLAE